MKKLATHDIAPASVDAAVDQVSRDANAGNPYTRTSTAAALALEVQRLRKLVFTTEAARLAAAASARQPSLF